jgi:hypothetical protein
MSGTSWFLASRCQVWSQAPRCHQLMLSQAWAGHSRVGLINDRKVTVANECDACMH